MTAPAPAVASVVSAVKPTILTPVTTAPASLAAAAAVTPLRLVPTAVSAVPSEIPSPAAGLGAGFLPPKPQFVVAPSMHASVSTSANVMTVAASPYSSAPGISPVAAAAAAAAATPNIIAPPAAALYPGIHVKLSGTF